MKGNFDDLGQRMVRIFLPEVVMMLVDYEICPQLIKKDEAGALIKLINIESAQKNQANIVQGDLTAMNQA